MKNVNKFAMCALLAPALTVGASSVYAQTSTHSTAEDSALEQRTSQDRSGAQQSQRQGSAEQADRYGQSEQSGAGQSGQHHHGSQHGMGESESDRSAVTAQRPGQRMGQSDDKTGKQLSKAPANAFHADSLLGEDVKSQTGDETVGTVRDIVIDEDGQVLAVVVGVGGMLGMGERDVAIAWDSIQHTRDSDGDSKFTTSMTEESLSQAPEYDSDADSRMGTSDRSERRTSTQSSY